MVAPARGAPELWVGASSGMMEGSGGTGDADLSPFAPCSAVVLAELPPAERRRYLELLARRDCGVVRCGESWVANLRILAPGLAAPEKRRAAAARTPAKAKSLGPGKGSKTFSARKTLVREARRSPAALLESVEDAVIGGVDCSLYPRFASLVLAATRSTRLREPAGAPPPRVRPLSWTMRLVEEMVIVT